MAGTRTAPDFSTAAQSRRISMQLIDASGDTFSESLYVAIAATDLQVEALAAAYQAATQASLYSITDTFTYEGEADPNNATVLQRSSVKDGVNVSLKNASIPPPNTDSTRLVAPVTNVMQGNQDIPLASATEMGALFTALLALKAGYSVEAVQYTERRERSNNPKVKV